jgi:hypothetical protein
MSELINPIPIQQEVISDNKEIFNRIRIEILRAQKEILIASAWFTDNELFDSLLEKVGTTSIEIIIGDNEENLKLDFDQLKGKGGNYIKVKNVGYGIMHQKFCVIDRKLAIHGSYNYTNNAKRNNHESVIVTNHEPTVNSLIESFFSIKLKAFEKSGENSNNMPLTLTEPNQPELNSRKVEKPVYQVDYEQVLSSLIDAEINQFDRKELSETGYSRAESCNGDFNVLPNSLDTLYFNFTNDVNITEEKKVMLLAKISEQKISQLQLLDIEHNNLVNRQKIEFETTKVNLNNHIEERKANILTFEKKIDAIRKTDIFNFEQLIEQLRERINQAKVDFIKPRHRMFELIPISIIAIILFTYLVLFYSSAAYILLFSIADTMKAMKNGAEIPPHQVFEPNAISLSLQHGGSSIFFIFLFVGVPIAFALADRYVSNKFWKIFISFFLGIFLIDGMLAYTVAKSIHELRILTGETATLWQPQQAFSDSNFYLVFVMGAAALLVFKFIFSKLMSMFEARNADIFAQKNALIIQQHEDKIAEHKESIVNLEKQIDKWGIDIIEEKKIKESYQAELDNLPIQKAIQDEKTSTDYSSKKEYYKHITEIYINRVENNNPKISIDALRDRINIFLEGWNDYLHETYSITLATDKSSKATRIASEWLEAKLSDSKMHSLIN